MPKFKFKTSINCGGCVAKVKNVLDNNPHIQSWDVDISSPDKTLTVDTDKLKPEEIIDTLAQIGYRAESI